MAVRSVPVGSVVAHLAPGVAFLREDASVFAAMLEGWSAQQLGGRALRPRTVEQRVRVVVAFQRHVNVYPWEWTAALFDEWMADLSLRRRWAPTTVDPTRYF